MGKIGRALARAGCCSLLFFAANAGGESDWQPLQAAQDGFAVEIPGHAHFEYEYTEHMSILGTVGRTHYEIQHAAMRFDIERHDLPRLVTFLLSSQRLLDRTRDSLLEEHQLELHSEELISLQGYPGRRLFYFRDGQPEETRLYLAGSRLYLAAAGPYPAELRASLVDPFFASFRICLDYVAPCSVPRSPRSGDRVDHGRR